MAILYNIYTGSQFKPANPFRLLFTKNIYFYMFFTNHGYKEYQKMSVIIKENMDNQKTGIRIAFAGCMASGKSFAAASVKKHLGNAKIKSFSTMVKYLAGENAKFAHREGYQLVGKVGRLIDPECWVKLLTKEIQQMGEEENIIVDDIRYKNELIALRQLGFVIIYMKTPWHARLKRIQKRHWDDPPAFHDFVQWATHDSELQLETLPEKIFDMVMTKEEEVQEYIKSI